MTSVRSVLICSDDPIIRTSVINKLKELGFDAIYECVDGDSAVSTASASIPDIAILDTAMPRNDGLTAAREIRQKLKIPVILFLSLCDQDTLDRAKKIGVTTILTKPFRGQDLLPAIEMAFSHTEEVEFLKDHLESLNKTIESRNVIDKAKKVLLRTEGLTDSWAFRKIRKLAMSKQKSLRQIAEAILITEGV